jgi:hypothetical protein
VALLRLQLVLVVMEELEVGVQEAHVLERRCTPSQHGVVDHENLYMRKCVSELTCFKKSLML